jgi:RHS repeat-associated protein
MGVVRYTTVNGLIMGESRGGSYKTYIPDGLGSTAALKDSTGALTDTFRYWPYGEERVRTGTTATPFRYVGAEGTYRDAQGRLFVRARAYSPTIGRWMQPDPASQAPIGVSPYEYCLDSPVSWYDRTGASPKGQKKKGGGGRRGGGVPPWQSALGPGNNVIIWADPGGVGGGAQGAHLRICVPNPYPGTGSTWWGYYPQRPGSGGAPQGPGWIQRGDVPPRDTWSGGRWVAVPADPSQIRDINQRISLPPTPYQLTTHNCAHWGKDCLTPLRPGLLGDADEINSPNTLVDFFKGEGGLIKGH